MGLECLELCCNGDLGNRGGAKRLMGGARLSICNGVCCVQRCAVLCCAVLCCAVQAADLPVEDCVQGIVVE